MSRGQVTGVRVAHPIIASAAEDGTVCLSLILPHMVRPVARGTIPGLLDFNLLPGPLASRERTGVPRSQETAPRLGIAIGPTLGIVLV